MEFDLLTGLLCAAGHVRYQRRNRKTDIEHELAWPVYRRCRYGHQGGMLTSIRPVQTRFCWYFLKRHIKIAAINEPFASCLTRDVSVEKVSWLVERKTTKPQRGEGEKHTQTERRRYRHVHQSTLALALQRPFRHDVIVFIWTQTSITQIRTEDIRSDM